MKTPFVIAVSLFAMLVSLTQVSAAVYPPFQRVQESPGASPSPRVTAKELARTAPGADPEVIAMGLAAMRCAQANGQGVDATRLGIIDYSMSSRTPRLWVFDLPHRRLLFHELVAHGSGSGGDVPTRFSNLNNTHASSIGLYLTQQTYQGANGYSLRMAGLDKGFNDAAMDRAIVLHGATYVNNDIGKQLGRLGRSWGCPALPKSKSRPIINVMKDGQFLFAYYPDKRWLTQSSLAQCAVARLGNANAVKNLASAR